MTGPGLHGGNGAAGSPADEEARDRRLHAAREAFPAWQVIEVFGGYLAVPAGAAVVQSTTLDGLVAKLRQAGSR